MRFLQMFVVTVAALAAAVIAHPIETAWAGVRLGITPTAVPTVETSTPTPTSTSTSTPTPLPTQTPVPATNTPMPTATADPPATPVVQALNITKQVSQPQARQGDFVIYTVTVSNPGEVAIESVMVSDPLPVEVDYLSATTSQGEITYDATAHVLQVSVGTMIARRIVTITIRTRVNHRAQPGQDIPNTAVASAPGLDPRPSNTVTVQGIPQAIPVAGGNAPFSLTATLLPALLAVLLPLAGWQIASRLRPRR